jgi:hypothetical protein
VGDSDTLVFVEFRGGDNEAELEQEKPVGLIAVIGVGHFVVTASVVSVAVEALLDAVHNYGVVTAVIFHRVPATLLGRVGGAGVGLPSMSAQLLRRCSQPVGGAVLGEGGGADVDTEVVDSIVLEWLN